MTQQITVQIDNSAETLMGGGLYKRAERVAQAIPAARVRRCSEREHLFVLEVFRPMPVDVLMDRTWNAIGEVFKGSVDAMLEVH